MKKIERRMTLQAGDRHIIIILFFKNSVNGEVELKHNHYVR